MEQTSQVASARLRFEGSVVDLVRTRRSSGSACRSRIPRDRVGATRTANARGIAFFDDVPWPVTVSFDRG